MQFTDQIMKIYLLCLLFACVYVIQAQPTTTSVWDALEEKVAAVNITNFYFMLGNENGVFFTYQKGKQDKINSFMKYFYPDTNSLNRYFSYEHYDNASR